MIPQAVATPFVVSGQVAVTTMQAGTDTVAVSVADLLSYINAGVKSFTINTAAGAFTVPLDDELIAAVRAGKQLRFVLKGNVLEVYIGDAKSPAKTLDPAAVSGS